MSFHPPTHPPLYHGGGMSLHVRPRVKTLLDALQNAQRYYPKTAGR